jgi:ABC-type proline/glycine betaine transport system substrate-binding protein
MRLESLGIRGNSHLMMMDDNSDDIAHLVANWLAARP